MDVKWIEWITWDLGILMDFHPKDLINMSINGYCMGLKGSNDRLRST